MGLWDFFVALKISEIQEESGFSMHLQICWCFKIFQVFFEITDILLLNYSKYYLLTKSQELRMSTWPEVAFSTYVGKITIGIWVS